LRKTGGAGQEAAMIAYDTEARAVLDPSATPALPARRSSPAAALLARVLHNAAVFTLLLALALTPLAFRLYLIMR
jgi:hypothetical protein